MTNDKDTKVIKAWIDMIDLTQDKAWIKAQIEKRKEKIDYFVEKKKRYEAVLKKAGK